MSMHPTQSPFKSIQSLPFYLSNAPTHIYILGNYVPFIHKLTKKTRPLRQTIDESHNLMTLDTTTLATPTTTTMIPTKGFKKKRGRPLKRINVVKPIKYKAVYDLSRHRTFSSEYDDNEHHMKKQTNDLVTLLIKSTINTPLVFQPNTNLPATTTIANTIKSIPSMKTSKSKHPTRPGKQNDDDDDGKMGDKISTNETVDDDSDGINDENGNSDTLTACTTRTTSTKMVKVTKTPKKHTSPPKTTTTSTNNLSIPTKRKLSQNISPKKPSYNSADHPSPIILEQFKNPSFYVFLQQLHKALKTHNSFIPHYKVIRTDSPDFDKEEQAALLQGKLPPPRKHKTAGSRQPTTRHHVQSMIPPPEIVGSYADWEETVEYILPQHRSSHEEYRATHTVAFAGHHRLPHAPQCVHIPFSNLMSYTPLQQLRPYNFNASKPTFTMLDNAMNDEQFSMLHHSLHMLEQNSTASAKESSKWVVCEHCSKWRQLQDNDWPHDKFYCGNNYLAPDPLECKQLDDWLLFCLDDDKQLVFKLGLAGITTIEFIKPEHFDMLKKMNITYDPEAEILKRLI